MGSLVKPLSGSPLDSCISFSHCRHPFQYFLVTPALHPAQTFPNSPALSFNDNATSSCPDVYLQWFWWKRYVRPMPSFKFKPIHRLAGFLRFWKQNSPQVDKDVCPPLSLRPSLPGFFLWNDNPDEIQINDGKGSINGMLQKCWTSTRPGCLGRKSKSRYLGAPVIYILLRFS